MRYVAMLRGINVGKANRVRMIDLKAALKAEGLADVETYLQSGNVLFDAKGLDGIDDVFAKTFKNLGITSAVIVRSGKEMAKVVSLDPFVSIDVPDKHKMVSFLNEKTDEELPKLTPKEDAGIVLQTPKEIYSYWIVGERPPDITYLFKKVAKVPQTMRNWIVTQELARLTG